LKNALTIDVEDYYMVSTFTDVVKFKEWHTHESRVEMSTRKVLKILDERGIKATFFVLGWVAEQYPSLVKEIDSLGHEIASHGYKHSLAYDLSKEEFRQDTTRAKKLLEDSTGKAVLGYRAASYSVTEKSLWVLDILAEEGFQYDSSIFPIRHDRYGLPSFDRFAKQVELNGSKSILEIPLSTVRLFGKNLPIAGGGYLRLLPIGLIKRGIRSINTREKQPAIIYLHPWELDPEQPKISGSVLSNFRHNVNLKRTESKLIELIEEFQFAPIHEVYSELLPG
jgi:polysaccharide deacetylase family protein (PEP-CTERM system associated)